MPLFKLNKDCAKVIVLAISLLAPAMALGQGPDSTESDQVIQPQIDRRQVRAPHIDTDDFEIGAFGGLLSIEDFGAKPVYGARLAYHVSEDYFVEAVYAKSTISDQALCDLSLCLFSPAEQDLTYYSLSVGYELFPGEVFLGRHKARTTSVHVLAGIGNTSFVNQDHFTFNLGLGLQILPTDWLALHMALRDFMFESDLLGSKDLKNNFEWTFGVSFFF